MLTEGFRMDIFIRELKKIVKSIVVKRRVLAKEKETAEMTREAELFLLAKSGLDTFNSYSYYEPELYRQVGITSGLEIMKYNVNTSNIPNVYREPLLKLKRSYIINNYVEKNDYYRMLMGLPDYEETIKLKYLTIRENNLGIPLKVNSTDIINRGLHELTIEEVSRLEESGYLDKIRKEYPEKKYLNHLGSKKIDNYKARKALNYEILYITTVGDVNIISDFRQFYDNAREYFMNIIYNEHFAKLYKYYDNFIGLCIVSAGIQRLFSSVFTKSLSRDFYDIQIIRHLFDSYSIPYIKDMTSEQIILLAKNLNIFLNLKSSNQVLFDMCKVFGFDNVEIYKYYLVKNHKFVNGKPMNTSTTTIYGDGSVVEELDYKTIFDVFFQRVKIKSEDILNELRDPTKRYEYDDLTDKDLYWINDEKLIKKLYSTPFNYIETKYISLDIMFKLTETMYDVNHFFRMIIQKNQEFSKIEMLLPEIVTGRHNIYSVIVFACALFCNHYGFTGEIPSKPAGVSAVYDYDLNNFKLYGFNFNDSNFSVSEMMEEIYNNDVLDDSMVKYINDMVIIDESDVDRIFTNIKTLHRFIKDKIANAKTLEELNEYRKLYKVAMTVEDTREMYGNLEITDINYFTLLEKLDPVLYDFLTKLEGKEDTKQEKNKKYVETMRYVLTSLEQFSDRLVNLYNIIDESDSVIVIRKLIKFFKSYTVDLIDSKVLFILDDRSVDKFFMFEKVDMKTIVHKRDNIINYYFDNLNNSEIIVNKSENLDLRDTLLYKVVSERDGERHETAFDYIER